MLGDAATAVTVGVTVGSVAAAVTVTLGGVLDWVEVAGEDVLDGDADAVTVGGRLDRAGTAVAVAGASIAGEDVLGGAAATVTVGGVLDGAAALVAVAGMRDGAAAAAVEGVLEGVGVSLAQLRSQTVFKRSSSRRKLSRGRAPVGLSRSDSTSTSWTSVASPPRYMVAAPGRPWSTAGFPAPGTLGPTDGAGA